MKLIFFETRYDCPTDIFAIEDVLVPRVGEFVHIDSICYVVSEVTYKYDKMRIHIMLERR